VSTLSLTPLTGFAQTPFWIGGAVEIDLTGGGIVGDLCIRDATGASGTISFVLADNFQVHDILNGAGHSLGEPLRDGPADGVAHYRVPTDPGRPGAEDFAKICVRYSGVFPVHDVATGGHREDDRSERVAFNGRTVRARGISRWYPAPTRPDLGVISEAVSFDVVVTCAGCTMLYVNGGDPTPGPTARFRSHEPREFLLYAGDLPVVHAEGLRIIGEDVDPRTVARFRHWLGEIQAFYSMLLDEPFGEELDVLRITPLRVERRGQLWGFYSDPALALIGMSIPEFVRILDGPDRPARQAVFGFLSHELAHRYFGWRIGSDSPARDLFGEPFANLLELRAIRHFFGEEAYRREVRALREGVPGASSFASLPNAGPSDFAEPRYRYGYAPLLLLALEAEIGEPAMTGLMRQLLDASGEERAAGDFSLLRVAAERAGIDPARWERWENECVAPPARGNRCLERVGAE